MIVDGELIIPADADAFRPGAAKELLAIATDYAGVGHAIYPTACRTLCSMPDDTIGDVDRGDDGEPDCLVCATTAAAFDRIDRSAPARWFRPPQEQEQAA